MKPGVGVLSYNVLSGLRTELLSRTLASLEVAFPMASLMVIDNGSSDGSSELVLESHGRWVGAVRMACDHSPGGGRNGLADILAVEERPWVVMSDDDMHWRPDAGAWLESFWREAPEDVVLCGCLLEPDYPWSERLGTLRVAGRECIERASVPAAAWSFRGHDWPQIGPLKTVIDGAGEDVEACARLRERGRRLVAVALAEHIGDGYSQLGNDEARSRYARGAAR